MLYPSFCVWYRVEHHVSDALIHKNNQLIKSASLVGAWEHSSTAQPCRHAACLAAPSAAAEQEGSAHSAVHAEVQKPGTPGVLRACAMFLPDTCHQGPLLLPSLVLKTKSNSGAPVPKSLERGFRPLMISLFSGGGKQGLVQKVCLASQSQHGLLEATPCCWWVALQQGPLLGEGRGGRVEAAESWLFPRADSGLCDPCTSIAEERDTSRSRVSQICSLLGISEREYLWIALELFLWEWLCN